jgi:protocatechuate 3,4-dioxygenase beta subunit
VVRLHLAIIISAVFALAQQPFSSIDGHVTDANGQPLRKAGVTLRAVGPGGGPYSADTDAAGKFSFDEIKPGGYSLEVERPGYLRKFYRAEPHETFSTIALAPGQRREFDITLARAASISGRVFDQDGDPVAKVPVRLLHRMYQPSPNLNYGRTLYTDDSGKYEIPGLPPGEYYLSAGVYGEVFSISGMQVVNRPTPDPPVRPGQTPEYYTNTFYPSGQDQTAAQPIQILHEDVQGMDIHLLKSPGFRVGGKVAGTIPGHPLEQYRIAIGPADSPFTSMLGPGSPGPAVSLAKDGSFQFPGQRFPPGDYFIVAMSPGTGPGLILARERLTIGNRDIDNAVLNLQPLVELRGRVAIEGEPQTDFSKLPGNPPPSVTMQVSLSFMHGPKLNDIRSKIQSDGSFTLADIAPGTYDVNVFGKPGGTWVKSIRIGSSEMSKGGIDINASTAEAPLQITLSRTVGQIAGVVETGRGKPAGGSTVTLFNEPPGRESMSSGVGENGEFTLQQVPPGTYRLYAWEDLEMAQRYDPQLLKAYESSSVVFTVRENGRERVSVTQIPLVPELQQ